MCWKEIILIFVGALVSIFTTVVSKIMENWLKQRGDIYIYGKVIFNKNIECFCQQKDVSLIIPVGIEIQNSKKIPIIIRDLNLILYKDGKKVKEMIQIREEEFKKNHIFKEIKYGENSQYSFVVKPESIIRYDCLYIADGNSEEFDEVRISYYDSKNRRKIKKFKKINIIKNKQIIIDENWILIT